MRLLIALPDRAQALEIRYAMEKRCWETEAVFSGEDVLARQGTFDVLLLHQCLSGMDGIRAGEQLAALNPVCPPLILLISSGSRRPLWADCVAEPGVSAGGLCSLLSILAQKPLPRLAAACSSQTTAAVEELLSEIRMDVRLKGRVYAAWLLHRLIHSPASAAHPLQQSYAACAAHFGTSAQAVERCLRIAVEQVFTQGSMQGIERHFGATIDPERGKPTNRAFLLQAAEGLRTRLLYSFTAARSPNSSEMHHNPAAPTSV